MVQTEKERKAKAKESRDKPENKAKANRRSKEFDSKPENKAKAKERGKTPEYKAYQKEFDSKPENKAKAKERKDKPENKAKEKKRRATPEYKAIQKKLKSKLEYKANQKKYASRPENRAREKKRVEKIRLKVLQYYSKHLSDSDIPCCWCCGESHIEFLALDHAEGRKEMDSDTKLVKLGYSSRLISQGLVNWIIRNNFPEGFKILCHNCNMAKGIYGKCPHEKESS